MGMEEVYKSGRVMMAHVHLGKGVEFLCINVYGWSGAHTNTDNALRTDDILARVMEELRWWIGIPTLLCGGLNGDLEDFPPP